MTLRNKREREKKKAGDIIDRTEIVCVYKFKDTSAGSSALREQSRDEGKWSACLKRERKGKKRRRRRRKVLICDDNAHCG